MFLIPFKTKDYTLTANDKSVDKNNLTIYDYISQKACGTGVTLNAQTFDQAYQTIRDITPTAIGMSDSSKMANLCTSTELKYFKDAKIIKIPLYYTLLQKYAKKFDKGQKFVTQMSPYNIEPLTNVQKV